MLCCGSVSICSQVTFILLRSSVGKCVVVQRMQHLCSGVNGTTQTKQRLFIEFYWNISSFAYPLIDVILIQFATMALFANSQGTPWPLYQQTDNPAKD